MVYGAKETKVAFLIYNYRFGGNVKYQSCLTDDMMLEPTRGLHLYLQTLAVALEDGRITLDEASMLTILAKVFDVPAHSVPDCIAIANGEMTSPISDSQSAEWSVRQTGDVMTYQAALIAALDDDVITADEMSMLDSLRETLGLQQDEHALIEEAIRATASEDDEGRRRLDRLEEYLGRSPWS